MTGPDLELRGWGGGEGGSFLWVFTPAGFSFLCVYFLAKIRGGGSKISCGPSSMASTLRLTCLTLVLHSRWSKSLALSKTSNTLCRKLSGLSQNLYVRRLFEKSFAADHMNTVKEHTLGT